VVHDGAAFETRDFYLACFLRCTGYDLIDLRAEGRRKIFVFRDRLGKGNRRDLVVEAGKSHKFTIPEEELPR